MGKIRTIKPDFFRSRSLAKCSRDARLTFEGLWTEADDHGRGVADPRLIKGAIWPLDDDVTPDAIGDHMAQLESTGHVVLYAVDGDHFYEIRSWEKHQSAAYRRGDAVYPTPEQSLHDQSCGKVQGSPQDDGDNDETPPSTRADFSARSEVPDAHSGVPLGKGREGKGSAASRRGCRIPDDFTVTDDMLAWAKAKPILSDIDRETEKFVNYWTANGKTKVDWVATWKNWMLQGDDYAAKNGRPQPVGDYTAAQPDWGN